MGSTRFIKLLSFCLLLTACGQVDYSAHRLPDGLSGEKPTIKQDFFTDITENRRALTLDYLERHNPALYEVQKDKAGLKAISFDPKIIVVHYTVIKDLEATVKYFSSETIEQARAKIAANGALNVGIQFVVDRDGTIYQLYPENVMARHTIGLNHVAIGIENIGNGDLGESDKSHPLTDAQLFSNAKLIVYLAGKYTHIKTMIAHSEYRQLEDKNHPEHALFYEEYPDYRTDKVDPGDAFIRALRQSITDRHP